MSGINYGGTPELCYEHVFTNYIEHRIGTNEYTYAFPEHWNSYAGQKKVGLRSITVKSAARDLRMKGVSYKYKDCDIKIGFRISLGQSEDMSVLNTKLKKAIKTKYIEHKDEIENERIDDSTIKNEFGIDDYSIEYEHSKGEFWFKVLKNDPNNDAYIQFDKDCETFMSDDLKAVLSVDNELFHNIALLQAGDITREAFEIPENVHIDFIRDTTKILGIGFKQVWNRESLFISSTLSTLAEDKFLTLSNIEHNTLKWYDVNGYTTTFTLMLFDLTHKNKVEIPNDGRDLLLVEMLMTAD